MKLRVRMLLSLLESVTPAPYLMGYNWIRFRIGVPVVFVTSSFALRAIMAR